jgi:hypothetical protein
MRFEHLTSLLKPRSETLTKSRKLVSSELPGRRLPVAGRYNVSEHTASAWTGKDMSPAAQHARRGSTGGQGCSRRRRNMRSSTELGREELNMRAIDNTCTRAAIAEVTHGRLSEVQIPSSHAFYVTFPNDSLSSCKSF